MNCAHKQRHDLRPVQELLGFRFAPRFRDLADQRFWRADLPDGEKPAAGYGPLEDVVCNKVNLEKLATHWPDMLRVAGSHITHQVRAYDPLRMFGREGQPPRSGRRSPSTGASTRPCACSPWSTRRTTPTGA